MCCQVFPTISSVNVTGQFVNLQFSDKWEESDGEAEQGDNDDDYVFRFGFESSVTHLINI